MINHLDNCIALTDKFIDFEGKEHPFVIVGLKVKVIDDFINPKYMFSSNNSNSFMTTGLQIGVAICNPEDTFNEDLGILKAASRAKKSEVVMCVQFSGQLTPEVIEAYLMQESKYLKSNPDKYMRGYKNAVKKFQEQQEMEKLKESFNDLDKLIVEKLKTDSTYLDKINTYMTYWNKCKNKEK